MDIVKKPKQYKPKAENVKKLIIYLNKQKKND
jgi:hypothetical protein